MLIFSVSFQFYRMISEENPLVYSGQWLRGANDLESGGASGHTRAPPSRGDAFAEWSRRRPAKPAVPGSIPGSVGLAGRRGGTKNLVTLLDLCVSSLRRGHANLLCIVTILTDSPQKEFSGSVRFFPNLAN